MKRIMLALVCGLGLQVAQAKIYQWTDTQGRVHYSDRPPPEQLTSHDNAAPAADVKLRQITSAGGVQVLTKPEDLATIREDLLAERFVQLEQLLRYHQNALELSIEQESRLMYAYQAFAVKGPQYEEALNRWVAQSADNASAYLARARFYLEQGTPGQSRRALRDTQQAIQLNPRSWMAYWLQIRLGTELKDAQLSKSAQENAQGLYPLSLLLNVQYLRQLTPRQGGSFEQMQKFIQQIQLYSAQRSQLNTLQGWIAGEQGNLEAMVTRYNEAIQHYNEALQYGAEAEWLLQRAVMYYRLQQYDAALQDLNLLLSQDAFSSDGYFWRAKTYLARDAFADAVADMQRAYVLAPQQTKIEELYQWLRASLLRQGYEAAEQQQYDKALQAYQLAESLGDQDDTLLYWRARAQIGLQQWQAAQSDLDNAIALNPDYNYFLLMDWLLAQQQQWMVAAQYWQRFIQLQPEHAEAYFKLSQSYYHAGRIDEARRSAKHAAQLGHPEGWSEYERMMR